MFWKLLFGKKEEKKEEQKQEAQQETKAPVSLPVIQEEHHDEDAKFVPLNTITTKTNEEESSEKITEHITIGELVKKYPGAEAILTNYGVHCVGCHANPFETLAQGILGHGMSQEQLNNLVKELNEKLVAKKETKHTEHKKHKVHKAKPVKKAKKRRK